MGFTTRGAHVLLKRATGMCFLWLNDDKDRKASVVVVALFERALIRVCLVVDDLAF